MSNDNSDLIGTVIPLLEFDPAKAAILEPQCQPEEQVPECVVGCFFQDVITARVNGGQFTPLAPMRSEMGEHAVYECVVNNTKVAVFQPGIGAPLSAGLLEEMIVRGGRNFIFCGGAGVLVPDIACGQVVVPTSAIRDEGTSFHYLPPNAPAKPSTDAVSAIEFVLSDHNVPWARTCTWTTDGIYRETVARAEKRRSQGCAVVEMEAAALFAVAEFRKVRLACLLYGGDTLAEDVWDSREWHKHPVREILLDASIEACAKLKSMGVARRTSE